MSVTEEFLTVQVFLGARSYDIAIQSNTLATFAESLQTWVDKLPPQGQQTRKMLVVTDNNLAVSHAATVTAAATAAGWSCAMVTLEPGETSKSLAVIANMYDRLVEMGADRFTIVVAVGGGVVGDAAGFAAATYNRGIPFVQVPTSLLAMVDSSVGGKVGVNHPAGKNLIGAFYQPLGVFIDTHVLSTLPDRDYRSGLAEVIKYGTILDVDFFEYLEQNVAGLNARTPEILRFTIAASCRFKADVVEQDEQETTGLRAILNYGHTFAHAYENLCGYGVLLHGEAVAIGMVAASRLAEELQMIPPDVTQRQIDLLHAVSLPTELPTDVTLATADILACMQRDKKTVSGKLRFILPTRLGHVQEVKDVPEAAVRKVLER